jgi:flagellin
MRIQTNVSAMNAHRNMGANQKNASVNIQRLSTGFRINQAKDDAAGLAIANKLRADVTALRQASRNASQATSMLQVADGAAQSIGSILERMKELATQANSANIGDQATKLQAEFSELISEIDRITSTVQYQGTSLVNGGFGSSVDAAASTVLTTATTGVSNVRLNGAAVGTYTLGEGANDGELTLTDGTVTQLVTGVAEGRGTVNFSQFGITLETNVDFSALNTASTTDTLTIEVDATTAAAFQVSSSGQYSGDDQVNVNAIDLTSGTLNVAGLDIDDANGGDSAAALAAIDGAIDDVNDALGTIGAAMNRIDFAQQNTEVLLENTKAAESAIRDADMAEEMMEFTKNNILTQAAQSMLAQANQQQQGILQLLR